MVLAVASVGVESELAVVSSICRMVPSSIYASGTKIAPSRYCYHCSTMALESVYVETWARHWLDVFITGRILEVRWGAGQLFLACVDSRFMVWAWPMIKQS